jgi:hypothetical protein
MTDASDEAIARELSLLVCRRAGAGEGDTAWDMWAERTEALIRALAAERAALRRELRHEEDMHSATIAERDAARAALGNLMGCAQDFMDWVRKNPEQAADPCAEAYNLECSAKAAWAALAGEPQA